MVTRRNVYNAIATLELIHTFAVTLTTFIEEVSWS